MANGTVDFSMSLHRSSHGVAYRFPLLLAFLSPFFFLGLIIALEGASD